MEEGLPPALLSALSGDDDSWLPQLRQLWWESWAHCSQDIENRARAGIGGATRQVSMIGLDNRRNTTLDRLKPGCKAGRSTDTSDALLKPFINMTESGAVRYPEWGSCTTRELETLGTAKATE